MIVTYSEPSNPEYKPFLQEVKQAAQAQFNFTMEDGLVRLQEAWPTHLEQGWGAARVSYHCLLAQSGLVLFCQARLFQAPSSLEGHSSRVARECALLRQPWRVGGVHGRSDRSSALYVSGKECNTRLACGKVPDSAIPSISSKRKGSQVASGVKADGASGAQGKKK